MRILFCGSFKFFEEMKKVQKDLTRAGFKCVLPKFAFGKFSSKKIEEIKENMKKHGLKDKEFEKIVKVKKRFYDELRKCEIVVVFNKSGYIGLSVAAEIGAAYVLNKPVFFLEPPKDHGLKALLKFAKNFQTISPKKLINKLKELSTE
jgi:hypothetical protein